jgi:hypothetical protein
MNRTPTFVRDRLQEILMKRYAVEKVVGINKLVRSVRYAVFSFALFQFTWILIASHTLTLFHRIVLEIAVISALALFWRKTWNVVGKFIPKFVWIGLLGWFFIAANIIPGFMINDNWKPPGSRQSTKNEENKKTGENANNKKNIHSYSIPGTRFASIYEGAIDSTDEVTFNWAFHNYIEIFIVPASCPALLPNMSRMALEPDTSRKIAASELFKFFRYSLILLAFILFIDIFLSVSIYKQRYIQSKWLYRVFSGHSAQKEKDVKWKLLLFSFILIILSVLSLNYFLLFWVLSILTTVFIFRWEIQQRGQNHKPLSRAVLFVFLTQIFSALSGMILFLTMIPVYTFIHNEYMVFNIYDSIVLGWAIILGSSVTVLLGIITQVIWSGRRMTEELKD